jgi:hypothetical protein
MELSERNTAFAALGLNMFTLAVLFMTGGAALGGLTMTVLFAIGALGLFATYASFVAGYTVMPLITKNLRVTEIMGNGYKVPPSQDVVLKNVGGIYEATIFMKAKFYEAATSETEEAATTAYMELWERALAGIKFPMKFSLIAYLEDIAKYRENIETQRYAATIKLGKEKEKPQPDALVIDKWEKEKARLDGLLYKLTAGEKPMGAVMYVGTTGIGVSEDAAVAAAKRQVGEIRSTVANALNVEIKAVNGEDMKRCFRWETWIPPDPKEFVASM